MNAEPRKFNRLKMRSKLFVPVSQPDLFLKAFRSATDAVCFDLEDSVLPDQKTTARAHLRHFLESRVITQQTIVVRVNALHSSFFADDLSAIVWHGVAFVNLPKTEDPAEIHQVAETLSKLEQERGIARPIAILPTIESPRGLRVAYAIASADSRVAGLQLGLIDLLLPLGIDAHNVAVQQLRLQLRLAAGEAELPCFDSAFSSIADLQGFTADAQSARSLGFSGKSCIHPSQVSTANQIFSPTAEEIAAAHRILDKAREASVQGHGAFALDGRMIDGPIVRHAEEILQLAASTQPDTRV